MDRWTGRRMVGWVSMWMDDGWLGEWMDGRRDRQVGWVFEWMYRWMDD